MTSSSGQALHRTSYICIMDLFRNKNTQHPNDVKMVRDTLLHFIKDQLGKVEGGEGSNIKGIHLFIACDASERHIYESAIYMEDEDRFKNEEIQRIADDYAIDLPLNWTYEAIFGNTIPAEAIPVPGLEAGIFIRTKKTHLSKSATGYIKVLSGEAEQPVYTINSSAEKINIGRDQKAQGPDGFFRVNQIAFPSSSNNESNKYISRQHAHIQFDENLGEFIIFADSGGIPPANKVKVRASDETSIIKLHSTRVGHALQEGDQIMLGKSAILEFSYSNTI